MKALLPAIAIVAVMYGLLMFAAVLASHQRGPEAAPVVIVNKDHR